MGHFSEMMDEMGELAKRLLWRPIETAPTDGFILLWCSEDNSRWLAKWQGGRWYGVDDMGLTREGYSAGDPNWVTGWAVDAWMPLPDPPYRESAEVSQTTPD